MARAGRKRKVGERYPSGQIRSEEAGPSPAQTKRLMMAALAGMADAAWSTIPGVYFLSGKISPIEYEAAKRFAQLLELYAACLQGPRYPKTSSAEKGSVGAPVDVESDAGLEEVNRHIRVMQRYNDAHVVLIGHGLLVESAVLSFCNGLGQTPNGYEGLLRAKQGLNALAEFWKINEKAAPKQEPPQQD